MSTQHEMRLPFTTKKEILDWEAYYKESQNQTRQELEASVIGFRKNVLARQKSKTPNGYLLESELLEMAKWKDHRLPSKIKKNPLGRIEDVTAEAFRPGGDWAKLKKLIGEYGGLYGVGAPVASVILHLYDRDDYPLIDKHALRSIGIDNTEVNYDEPFWRKYVKFCCTEAERYDVSMRALDRALYKYSESGAVLALQNMADETLFLELKRRGYNLSTLRNDEKTTEEKVENWENRNLRDAADVEKNTNSSNLDQSLAKLKRDVLGGR